MTEPDPSGRRRSLLAAAAVAVAITATVAACGQGGAGAAAGRSAAGQSAAGATSASTTEPAPVTPAPTASSAPGGGDQSVPATTSGALDAKDLPVAADIGRGWRPYVDPGDPDEGYAGNGAYVRARKPADVAQSVVPLGCAKLVKPPTLPRPQQALEATFRGPGAAPAVALALEFAAPAEAAAFLGGMARIARSCPQPGKPVAGDDPPVVVVTPVRVDPTTVLDRRRELGYGSAPWLWSEAIVASGRRVGLLIVASTPGQRPDLARLAGRVRSALGE